MDNGGVITIRKHIVAQEALSCGCEGVCVDEAADSRVVITALQVIESGFFNVIYSLVGIFYSILTPLVKPL